MSAILKGAAALAVIIGLLFYLQSRVGDQPQTRVEKTVSSDALR
jgi:hypothetical protein